MSHVQISHSREPIRLFRSRFLEFFTHIHPAVIVIVWLPVALWFLRRHHMQHHVQVPVKRYGVTSPLWHYVLGTEPAGRERDDGSR